MSAATTAAPLPPTLFADRVSRIGTREELAVGVRRIATASADADGFQEFTASGRRHTL